MLRNLLEFGEAIDARMIAGFADVHVAGFAVRVNVGEMAAAVAFAAPAFVIEH
jgi:hypothetical protein